MHTEFLEELKVNLKHRLWEHENQTIRYILEDLLSKIEQFEAQMSDKNDNR